MWDLPSYRARAYVTALNNSREKSKSARKRTLHLRKVHAEFKVVDGYARSTAAVPAGVLLNDITAVDLRAFSAVEFLPGQDIAITIEEPRYFFIHARVTFCHLLSTEGKIISPNKYRYRMGVRFIFDSPAEAQAVKNYFEQIHSEYLYGRRIPTV